jgi:hypothetical protein
MSLRYEKLEIKLVENGAAVQIINTENNTSTVPIKIEPNPEGFAEWLATQLSTIKIISNKEDFRRKLLEFLKGERAPAPTIVFQQLPKPEEAKPEIVKPEVVPERVDITKYAAEEEVPVVIPIKEEEKPEIKPEVKPPIEEKKIDTGRIVAMYQELYRKHAELEKYGVDVHAIVVKQIAEAEKISVEEVERIVPRIKPEEAAPTPTPIPTKPMLPKEVEDELKQLPPSQRQMLEKLAEYLKTDLLSLVARLYEEGEKAEIPSHWFAVANKYARSLGIIPPSSERVIYCLFVDASGQIYSVGLKRDIAKDVKIDRCYRLPISKEPLRCIARTIVSVQRDVLPEDLRTADSIEEVADVPAIPKAIHFLKSARIKISDLYSAIKKSEQGMGIAAITGTIENVRSPKKGLYYFNVNDGSLRGIARSDLLSVELPVPNPFGIDDNMMRTAEGKDVFVYGTAILTLPSEKFSREGIKMKPMYIKF